VRCNQVLSPKSSLFGYVRAITGYDPPRDFNVAKLKGMPVEIEIEHGVSESDGLTYPNIVRIRRARTATDTASEQRVAKARDGFKKNGKKSDKSAPVDDATSFPITDEDLPENLRT
jgi:hypothetical protein